MQGKDVSIPRPCAVTHTFFPGILVGAALLAACGGSGSSPPPLPTASLSASPTTVSSGGEAVLTWSSTNATSCTASGGWTGAQAASGTQSTGALTAAVT